MLKGTSHPGAVSFRSENIRQHSINCLSFFLNCRSQFTDKIMIQHRLQIRAALVISLALIGTVPSLAAIFYVTQAGAGLKNGSSWANAATGTNLQSMIAAASEGDQVWVGCGTYFPTTGTDRGASFSMKNGVEIYGGFKGTESTLDQREFTCGFCSLLCGEIGLPGKADNSYTVVRNERLDDTAVLDGFLIRDGNDDRQPAAYGPGLGGGMYNHANNGSFCHPVVRNCLFTANFAYWGGGAFNNGYNGGDTQPTYINCIFYENHAYREGGGMDSYGVGGNASPTLINCIFYGNTADTNVGGMYSWGGNEGGNANPIVINSLFVNNKALNGFCGGFVANNLDENGETSSGSSIVTLLNTLVWGNTSNGAGQQFYVEGVGAEVRATYSGIDLTGQVERHVLSGVTVGNITAYPQFANIADPVGPDGCWLTEDDGLRLPRRSPAVNAGNETDVYTTDILGNERVNGSAPDMGPYENFELLTAALTNGNELLVYPNPATDWLMIRGKGSKLGEVKVFNSLGQLMPVKTERGSQASAQVILNLTTLPPGLYLVKTAMGTRRVYKE